MADFQLYSLNGKTKKKPVLDILGNPIKTRTNNFKLYDVDKTKTKKSDVSGLQYTGQIIEDILTQPVGGVVDAAESIANLALPKEKEIEISDVIPEANTAIGRFIRPASQFFIPYAGAFKIAKGATLFVKNGKELNKVLQTGQKVLKTEKGDKGTTIITRQGSKIKPSSTESLITSAQKTVGRETTIKPKFRTKKELFVPTKKLTRKQAVGIGLGAGAIADAFAFAPTDPNLADLFVQYPSTKFAVFEWLATDPDGDPSMERLKNVIAGLVPSAVIPEITRGVAKGFKYVSNPVGKKFNRYTTNLVEREQNQFQKIINQATKQNKKVDAKKVKKSIEGRRTFREKVALKFKNQQFGKKLIINFLDNVRGIKYLEDAAKGLNVRGLKGFGADTKGITAYQEARFLPAVGGMVEHFLLKQTFRFKDGVFESTGKDGLQNILAKNLDRTDNVDDFFTYVGAKSLQALKETDKKTYRNILNTKALRDEFDGYVKTGDKKASYKKTLSELNRFNEDLLQVAVDTQLISAKTMANLIKKRKPYMPLYRDLSSDSLLASKAGAGNKLRAKLKGAPVSELPFANFFDNYIENVNGIISSAYKNHVKRSTFDIIDSAKKQNVNMNDWAEKLSTKDKTKLRKIKIKPAELKKEIGKQETSLNLNNLDDLDDLTLFRSDRIGGLRDREEFVLRTNDKGETVREVYKIIDDSLYTSLSSISPKQYYGTNAFVGFARFWKNLLTRAVTYDPGFFAGANFIRDTVSASILSRSPFHLPFFSTAIRYRNKVMSNKPIKLKDGTTTTYKKLSQEFFLNGGSFASTLLKGELQDGALKRIYRQMGHSDYNNVLNTPRRFLDGYESVVTGFENASRFTEFVLLRKAGRSARQAAFEAREVAVDFGMQGAWNFWRQYVSTVPFLNAGLQGLFRTARALTPGSGQVSSTIAKISAFVGTPTLAFYIMNKDNPDYYKQSQQVRDLNFMIPLEGGNWLKIPKPFELGAISTILENFLDTLNKTGNADKFFTTAWTVLKAQTRLSVVPQVFSPILNSAFNQTYFGSPIIPEGMKHSIPDYGQSYPWSNKAITSAVENAPPWLRDRLMSPIEFENFFRAYTGTIGGYFLDLLDTGMELHTDVELKDWRLDEYPILKRFLTLDPAKYTSYEQRFYELKKKATQAVNQAKKFKDEFKFELLNEFMLDEKNQELMALSPILEQYSRIISDYNRQRNIIQNAPQYSGETKKIMIDQIEGQVSIIFDKIMTDLENRDLKVFEPMIKFTPISEQ